MVLHGVTVRAFLIFKRFVTFVTELYSTHSYSIYVTRLNLKV
ncbi:MAG: hypothetical protein FD169_220 [Bacillota bacterium]|nr:MAG: hypothetical protein FD169_220 [Bacillota bacterium]